jgi:signal peptidase
MRNKATNVFSKLLTVMIVFLVVICMILFFKTITQSEISLFGYRLYYVATESMYPTITPYSIITVKEVDSETLKEGDVISFISRQPEIYGMVNTHRIYDIVRDDEGQTAFVTMGDNNPVPDSYYVYPEEIMGKVVMHTPPLKILTNVMSFAGTKIGFFIVIILPLMLIASMFMNSFIREFQASLREEARALEELRQEQSDANAAEHEDPARPVTEADSRQIAIQLIEGYFGKTMDEITNEDIASVFADIGKEPADGAEQSK